MKVQSSSPAGGTQGAPAPPPPADSQPTSKFSDVMARKSEDSASQTSTTDNAQAFQAPQEPAASDTTAVPPDAAQTEAPPADVQQAVQPDTQQPVAQDATAQQQQPVNTEAPPAPEAPVQQTPETPQPAAFGMAARTADTPINAGLFAAQQAPGEIPLQEIAPGEFAAQLPELPNRGAWGDPHVAMPGRDRVILSDREPMRGFGDARERVLGLRGEAAAKPGEMEGILGPQGEQLNPEGIQGEQPAFGDLLLNEEALLNAKGELKEKGKKKKTDKEEAFEAHVLRNMDQKEEELSADELAKLQIAVSQPQPSFQLQPKEVQQVERPRPVYDAQAIRGIVQEVRMVASPGDKTRIEIQLTSKTLEGLNIRIDRNEEGRLAIQFNTMNNDVAQLLERNMQNLQQSLAANGLRVANLQIVNPTVSTQPMFQQSFNQPSGGQNYSGDRERGGGGQGGSGGGDGGGQGQQGGGGQSGGGQQGRRGRR